jgi:hypothetical protein
MSSFKAKMSLNILVLSGGIALLLLSMSTYLKDPRNASEAGLLVFLIVCVYWAVAVVLCVRSLIRSNWKHRGRFEVVSVVVLFILLGVKIGLTNSTAPITSLVELMFYLMLYGSFIYVSSTSLLTLRRRRNAIVS